MKLWYNAYLYSIKITSKIMAKEYPIIKFESTERVEWDDIAYN